MLTNYFKHLNYSASVITGFFVVRNGRDEYYVCAYKDRTRGKKEIIDLLTNLSSFQNLGTGDFDFHHVVEEQHLADISFSRQQHFNYSDMPTVMIHKGEHKRYNAILHARETRFLYLRDQEKFTMQQLSSTRRKQAAATLFNSGKNAGAASEISNRLGILREIYESVYEDNKILQTIAANIFDEYQQILKYNLRN